MERRYRLLLDIADSISSPRELSKLFEELGGLLRQDQMVADRRFRNDLYYRFNVFPITMPPLRTHKEDIPAIAQALLAQIGARRAQAAIPAVALTRDAEDALLSYDWPGNVRELRNLLERAVILAEGRPLDGELVRSILESSFSLPSSASPGDLNLRRNLDSTERSLLLHAIERAGGRKKDAAAMLGIDPRNLGYYLRKHGLGEVPSR